MTTIIYIFFIALLASFFLTPFVRKVALRYDIVDYPSDRKIHTRPVARIGGAALFLSFILSFLVLSFNTGMYEEKVASDPRVVAFAAGALGIFILGLWDDFKPLPASIKFAGQIAVGIIVFFGGLQIHTVSVPFADAVFLGNLALPATVFWFVLVINAINLIDGLDGLAAGTCLFVSLTMLVICVNNGRITPALGFAALGGTLIGFLRYNFNPASIFMGDSGSYFLGYTIAALSIMGSIKGQVATAMLIPIIALGIPLIDAMWAPLRRFALGKKMFQPDTGHLHHHLVKLGYTQRRAVLIIYACTIVLGGVAIMLVHSNDEIAALVLLVLGAGSIFLVNHINSKEQHGSFGIFRWIHEVSDASGITRERRSFLHHQLLVSRARSIEALWSAASEALQVLEIDRAELRLNENFDNGDTLNGHKTDSRLEDNKNCWRHFVWQRQDGLPNTTLRQEGVLKLELPLLDSEEGTIVHFGTIVLVKNIEACPAGHFMLSRIEHLRRSIMTALKVISERERIQVHELGKF